MPVVKTKQNVKDATTPPKRAPVAPGTYAAVIQKVEFGLTRMSPPLDKFTCEYRLLKNLDTEDTAVAGKRVYQDYITEPNATNEEMNTREAYAIRQLLDATSVAYTPQEGGGVEFNTDHLVGKSVKIAVRQKPGAPKKNADGTDGVADIYNRVTRVDAMVVDTSQII